MSKIIIASDEKISEKIHYLRKKKVMLDFDLAELYSVETKHLKRQVKRNIERFPDDFMFELSRDELDNLRSQIGTSSWGGLRYLPMAFTEQGVAMLSGVLASRQAISVNIRIMRVFTRIGEILLTHKDILLKLEQIERKLAHQDTRSKKLEEEIQAIFKVLKQLLGKPAAKRNRIGYKNNLR